MPSQYSSCITWILLTHWHVLYYIYHILEKMPTVAPQGLFVHAHHVIPIQKPTTINNLPPVLEHQPCGHCCVCPLTRSKSQGEQYYNTNTMSLSQTVH